MPGAVLLVDEASRLYVVPGNPGPERSPGGIPMLSLIGSEQAASLQVGARWWPEEDELAGLTAAVGRALGRDPAELLVSAEAVSVSRVALMLGEGDEAQGAAAELATSQSSGTAPFNAVLAAPVVGAQLDLARRAFSGERDLLRVRLEGEIAAGSPCVTTILSASIDAALVELLESRPDVAGLESRIAAGAVGRVRIELDDVDPGMRPAADRRAAANFLRDAPAAVAAAGAARAVFRALGSVALASARSVVRVADVEGWISASGGQHVFLLPTITV